MEINLDFLQLKDKRITVKVEIITKFHFRETFAFVKLCDNKTWKFMIYL